MTGRLWWAWQENMKGEEMARIRGAWAEEPDIDGWVRDGASGHQGEAMQAAPPGPPPYAPELNPVERFFQELRRTMEDRMYPTLEAKKEALEPILKAWQADPARVRQLCGWDWIRDVLEALPADTQVSYSFWIGIELAEGTTVKDFCQIGHTITGYGVLSESPNVKSIQSYR